MTFSHLRALLAAHRGPAGIFATLVATLLVAVPVVNIWSNGGSKFLASDQAAFCSGMLVVVIGALLIVGVLQTLKEMTWSPRSFGEFRSRFSQRYSEPSKKSMITATALCLASSTLLMSHPFFCVFLVWPAVFFGSVALIDCKKAKILAKPVSPLESDQKVK